jgi:hypothetical protein
VLSTFERYQRIAPLYDLLDLPFEYGRYRQIRGLLFQGLAGRLLVAGVGWRRVWSDASARWRKVSAVMSE